MIQFCFCGKILWKKAMPRSWSQCQCNNLCGDHNHTCTPELCIKFNERKQTRQWKRRNVSKWWKAKLTHEAQAQTVQNYGRINESWFPFKNWQNDQIYEFMWIAYFSFPLHAFFLHWEQLLIRRLFYISHQWFTVLSELNKLALNLMCRINSLNRFFGEEKEN